MASWDSWYSTGRKVGTRPATPCHLDLHRQSCRCGCRLDAAGHDGRADVDQHAGRWPTGCRLATRPMAYGAAATLTTCWFNSALPVAAGVHAHQVAQLEGVAGAVQLEHAAWWPRGPGSCRPAGCAAMATPRNCAAKACLVGGLAAADRASTRPASRCRRPAKAGRRSRSRSSPPPPRPRDWCRHIANASCRSWFRSLEEKGVGKGQVGTGPMFVQRKWDCPLSKVR